MSRPLLVQRVAPAARRALPCRRHGDCEVLLNAIKHEAGSGSPLALRPYFSAEAGMVLLVTRAQDTFTIFVSVEAASQKQQQTTKKHELSDDKTRSLLLPPR